MKWSWEFTKSIESITYNIKLVCFFALGGIIFGRMLGLDASMYCFCLIMGCIIACIIDIMRNLLIALVLSDVNKTANKYLKMLDENESTLSEMNPKEYKKYMEEKDKLDKENKNDKKVQ